MRDECTYQIILADPPWTYRDKAKAGKRGASFQYPLIKLPELCNMPVAELAAKNCALFMWGTWPMLPQALVLGEAWGFEYRTAAFVWVKFGKPLVLPLFAIHALGKLKWGMGKWTRANSEFCLLFVKGRPKRQSAKVHQVLTSTPGRNSAKPPETRDRIVELLGDLPRVELFAREREPGWDAWGLDVESDPQVSAVLGEPGAPL